MTTYALDSKPIDPVLVETDGAPSAWWLANDAGHFVDIAGSEYAAMNVGGVTKSAGQMGPALSFNGTTGYVDTGQTLAQLGCLSTLTISFLAYANATAAISPLGDNGYDDNGHLDFCGCDFFNNNGQFWVRMRIGGTDRTVSGGTWAPAVWYLVHATYDGATVRLFANGVQVSSLAATGTLYSSPASVKIGRRGDSALQTSGPWYWPGLIDDVRIYPRAQTASEILRDYLDRWWRARRRASWYGVLALAQAGLPQCVGDDGCNLGWFEA